MVEVEVVVEWVVEIAVMVELVVGLMLVVEEVVVMVVEEVTVVEEVEVVVMVVVMVEGWTPSASPPARTPPPAPPQPPSRAGSLSRQRIGCKLFGATLVPAAPVMETDAFLARTPGQESRVWFCQRRVKGAERACTESLNLPSDGRDDVTGGDLMMSPEVSPALDTIRTQTCDSVPEHKHTLYHNYTSARSTTSTQPTRRHGWYPDAPVSG
ncbi:unnamed protein product [Gadus morhua 'NCC']